MSSYNIVVCVTGSIAAYKGCELVSYLTQAGHKVRVMMSSCAEKFVGAASFEALSKNPVWVEDFESPLMNHIEWGKWCDVCLVYPATAQTINSLASGVSSDPINSFFMAYDFKKPFIVAPSMNTRMLQNPVTQKSLHFLSQIGCKILPSDKGSLACGETGQGRVLSPRETITDLFHHIGCRWLEESGLGSKRILITAGGTRDSIDGVRVLTNISTGMTGAQLADLLYEQGHQVWLLTSQMATKPLSKVHIDTYESFDEIYNRLKALGQTHSFDMILHAAAISDYSVRKVQTPHGPMTIGQKMSSQYEKISIQLERNKKILPCLKDIFKNHPIVIGFKLTVTEDQEEQAHAIESLFVNNTVDYVVHNNIKNVQKRDHVFLLTSKNGDKKHLSSIEDLSQHVLDILQNRTISSQKEVPT